MTTPRRAASAADAPIAAHTTAAPRRAAAARPHLARTVTATALAVGLSATSGFLLLRPPAPTPVLAVAPVAAVSTWAPDATGAALAATPEPTTSTASATVPQPSTSPAAPAPTAAPAAAPASAQAPTAPARTTSTTAAAASSAPSATRTATPTAKTTTTRPSATATTAPATSTTAANAVTAQVAAYARAHIGYPYQVGTKGPEVFDCAGLVTAAFASAGVTVRHSMTTQAALGSYVSRENLRPGDIVIWGDPVSAVSIYIGNDTIVIGDGPAYGVRTVTITERMKYRSFQGGRRYAG
nr:C40 family peptidase [Propionibacterium sp.]